MEKFDSLFHKRYVTGEGIVIDKGEPFSAKNKVIPQSYEEIRAEYRHYVNDPNAELPDDLVAELVRIGKLTLEP